jgi:hypothetical protein
MVTATSSGVESLGRGVGATMRRPICVRGVRRRVSGGAGAMAGGPVAISGDGRYVVFVFGYAGRSGEEVPQPSVLVHDRRTGRTRVVSVTADGSPPDGPSGRLDGLSSYLPVGISADGRYVGFTSWASNLVAGDARGSRPLPRVFVRDLQTIGLRRCFSCRPSCRLRASRRAGSARTSRRASIVRS